MSVFVPQKLPCPACAQPVSFDFADSVNGTRRPDLRAAILDDTFQRVACGDCGAAFRVDPALTYLDVERHQWVMVRPAGGLAQWEEFEAQARALYTTAFGPGAGAVARELGTRLKARVTFGWPALREKLLCAAHDLDDVELELLKLGLVRWLGDTPLGDDVELRLTGVRDAELELAWIETAGSRAVETLTLGRDLYDDVRADAQGWAALRADLAGAFFVDLHRLLVEPDAVAAA